MSAMNHVSRVRRLYKLVLRVHRGLPAELRIMGDNYARDEFKRHKQCDPIQADIFLNEWTEYAINIAKQLKPHEQSSAKKIVGKNMNPEMLEFMTDEQICQLYELRKAAADDDSSHPERTEKF